MNMNTENNNSNELENIELAYEYTKDFLKDQKTDARHLDWRLGAFLAFGGLLFRFGNDLPSDQSIYLLVTKIGVLLLGFMSIAFAAWGLKSTFSSKLRLVKPSTLMENKYFKEETPSVKCVIINTHKTTVEELALIIQKKSFCLNKSIICLIISVLIFAANGMLNTWLNYRY